MYSTVTINTMPIHILSVLSVVLVLVVAAQLVASDKFFVWLTYIVFALSVLLSCALGSMSTVILLGGLGH